MSAVVHPFAPGQPEPQERPRPPHDLRLEQQLLGAVLANNESYHRVSGYLLPDHFFEPVHGRIYAAAARLIGGGRRADGVTLNAMFERDDDLKGMGGGTYLSMMAAAVVSPRDIEDYGRGVFELWQRRELVHHAEELRNKALDQQAENAAELLEAAAANLERIGDGGPEAGELVDLRAAGFAALQEAQDIASGKIEAGRKVELSDVDQKLGGLKRTDLLVLAGRTSMGKTALAVRFAERVATRSEAQGMVVPFFSMEMRPGSLANRVYAQRTGIPYQDIDDGRLDPTQFAQLARTVMPTNLLIDKTPAITFEALRARALRIARRGPIALLVVDHIGLMRPPKHLLRENRSTQIGHITAGLKALAAEIDAPVLALAQLNREPDKRNGADKRPRLSDLYESGRLEQDADVVLFAYREEYYLDQAKPREPEELASWQIKRDKAANVFELIIAKKRHGGTGIVPLYFNAALNKFGDLDRRETVF